MKIYTKTGDGGSTGLFGGARVAKDHVHVEAYGDVDELNSFVGMFRAHLDGVGVFIELDTLMAKVQRELFDLGAELATAEGKSPANMPRVEETEIVHLEEAIDRFESLLSPLQTFVLPGGSSAAATAHLARTVCRRAERRVVSLAAETEVRGELLRYLNRLSDLLFVIARVANHQVGVADVPWLGRDKR